MFGELLHTAGRVVRRPWTGSIGLGILQSSRLDHCVRDGRERDLGRREVLSGYSMELASFIGGRRAFFDGRVHGFRDFSRG